METQASTSGTLHRYAPGLIAFEHIPTSSQVAVVATITTAVTNSSNSGKNYLLFVGGLGDGLFTVPIAENLHELPEPWRLVEVLTSSSYTGWGMGSVRRDAEELVKCVEYFKKLNPEAKVVMMGHSTGSQDTFQYLMNCTESSPHKLDGAILQAPVSDREAVIEGTNKTSYLTSMNFAESWVKNGQGQEVIPREMRPGFENTPISAERWFSIAAPLDKVGNPQGNEDFFSSDINDATLMETFGKLPNDTRLLILYSGSDQFVPAYVDKEKLLGRWLEVLKTAGVDVDEGSGIVPSATHTLGDASAAVWEDFSSRVRTFLGKLDG